MNETFDDKCPYCGSKEISSRGHVNSEIAYNAEEYVCDGKCQRTFYIQCGDERFIMQPTMNNKYLSSDSLSLRSKEYFEKIAKEQSIDSSLPVCGNCVSYEWGKNAEDEYDRHCGSCYFQNERINFTISDIYIKGQVHGLTKATSCDNFFNFREEVI